MSVLEGSATAKDQAGFDPGKSASLKDIPVDVVILGDHLHAQIAYQYGSIDPSFQYALRQNAYTNQGIVAGAAGSALGEAIAEGMMFSEAKNAVKPAVTKLRTAQCDLSATDDLTKSVEDAVRTASWGSTTAISHHVMGEKQKLEDLVPTASPRYVFLVTYSLSPDFSTVMVTLIAQAYSQAIPGAREHWQKNPAWVDQIVIVSDPLPMVFAPRTADDIARAVAAENARFGATNAAQLIDKANDGDRDARKVVAPMVEEHQSLLHMAKSKQWTPGLQAVQRNDLWSENQCGRLKDALHADAVDLQQTLTQLFAGQLPPHPDPKATIDFNKVMDTEAQGERRVIAAYDNIYVLRRDGDTGSIDYRFSWYPEKGHTY